MNPERDLDKYQELYRNQPYERYQIFFRRKKVKEILARNKHDILLEIGCGLNAIFNDIESYEKLFVVEPGELFYNKAIEDLGKIHKKSAVVVKRKIIEDCVEEFGDVRFDFILLSSLLHEIPHADSFLNSIHRIASKNTIVHVNVPNAKSFHRLLAVEMGLIKDEFQRSESNDQFQQHTVFDIAALRALVERNGFRVVEHGTYSFKPFTHFQMEQMIQAGLITDAILDGFYRMDKYIPEVGSEIYVNMVKAQGL